MHWLQCQLTYQDSLAETCYFVFIIAEQQLHSAAPLHGKIIFKRVIGTDPIFPFCFLLLPWYVCWTHNTLWKIAFVSGTSVLSYCGKGWMVSGEAALGMKMIIELTVKYCGVADGSQHEACSSCGSRCCCVSPQHFFTESSYQMKSSF